MDSRKRNRILALAVMLGLITAGLIWGKMNSLQKAATSTTASSSTTAGSGTVENKPAPPPTKLAEIVKPYQRATTIELDPMSSVAGFLRPGNLVDIISSFELDGQSRVKTILQNVEVLAVGHKSVAKGVEGTGVESTPTATLALSPKEAEILSLHVAKGKLRLALRSQSDQSIAKVEGVWLGNRAVRVSSAVANASPPVSPVKPTVDLKRLEVLEGELLKLKLKAAKQWSPVLKTKKVEVIRGTAVTEKEVPA